MNRILLIEDDMDFRWMLSEMLKREGYEVQTADNGSEGVRLLEEEEPYDLIITDIIMPEKEGLETIMNIMNRNPGSKVIAISGGGRSSAGSYLKTAEYFGAVRSFQKPFDKNEFLEAVRDLVKA
jgi:DNA-binding NtrC family response regulator